MLSRKPYPTDISDAEWAFVAPYLSLIRQDAPQHRHDPREVFNGLRWVVRTGSPWRYLPKTTCPALGGRLPAETQSGGSRPGSSRRWSTTSGPCCARPRVDRRTRPPQCSTAAPCAHPRESGRRGGYDGAKRKKSSKVHAAVDTLGHLVALRVTPATEQDREQVEMLAEALQEATGESVELAYVDRGYSGERGAAAEAEARGIRLEVVKHPGSKKGFVLLPCRWVVERSLAWASRFRRLAKDYERLPETVAGLHFVAFACLFLSRAVAAIGPSP